MKEAELNIEKEQLHDSLIKDILIDREKEAITIKLLAAENYFPSSRVAFIIAEKISSFMCPMKNPWGRSSSINGVTKKGNRLEIEMQSGDIIAIEAESFKIVEG